MTPKDLRTRARYKLEEAASVVRLARTLSLATDREAFLADAARLQAEAEALEAEAAKLEARTGDGSE